MKTILLKLQGPMQAWGTDSHFETRQTDLYPSKSAIVGLISACFGYKRDDVDNINKVKEIAFATRIDQQGRILKDYHTAKKFKPNGDFDRTYVTNRYYLEDAIFVVALSHDDSNFMEEILVNLENPYYQPYLGRRSCPLQGDFILEATDKDIATAITEIPWQARKRYKKNHTNRLECFIDSYMVDDSYTIPRRDNIVSFSQKNRKHSYRNESRFIIEAIDLDNNLNSNNIHDFWEQLP